MVRRDKEDEIKKQMEGIKTRRQLKALEKEIRKIEQEKP